MYQSYPIQGQGSWSIYPPIPTYHWLRATSRNMSSLALLAFLMFSGQEKALRQKLHPCAVGYHWYVLKQWVLSGCGGALIASAPPYKLVSWLSSLTRLWPTSLVVCYVVGLLRLAKQRKTSWNKTSEGCWQNTCIMNKWTNFINLMVTKTHNLTKIWS